MHETTFILNNEVISTKADPAATLLDYIRKAKRLTGTKEGCKEGDCGSCIVLAGSLMKNRVKYKTINSCLFPVGNLHKMHIVTIEGLSSDDLNPIQSAFSNEGAAQCGFCTPGFIISLTGYLLNNEHYTEQNAFDAMAGNICRCTGYGSIKRGTAGVLNALNLAAGSSVEKVSSLIQNHILPDYFLTIPGRLKKIPDDHRTLKKAKYFVSGGTDLFVQKPDELTGEPILFLKHKNLDFIEKHDQNICIGAAATFEMLKESKIFKDSFPRSERFFNLIAALPVRNSATVGGNIINASPIGDLTIMFLPLSPVITFNSGRKILLEKLYKGYKCLDKRNDEYLESIQFPLPGRNSHFNFEKVSKRTHLDIASVNTAIYLETNKNKIVNIRISAGGVAPVPLLLQKTSEFLKSKTISTEILLRAVPLIQSEISPISDIRGGAEYKHLLLSQLFKAHFIELFPELIKSEDLDER